MMILDILNELAADNSRLAKEAILCREKDNVMLRKVIKYALDPYVNYWIKKIPEYQTDERLYTLGQALGMLNDFTDRTLTGNAAIEQLEHILSSVASQDATVIERIIQRDLRCGVQEATVNKIWPGTIPTFDVMLAHKDTSGIKYPAYAQVKSDGMRCHLQYDGKTAKGFTRNGKEIDLLRQLDQTAKMMMNPGDVFDGEIVFVDEQGKILDRKTGNGLGNKAVKGTISEAEAARARFVVWDIVDFSSTIPYDQRLQALNERFANATNYQVECKILASKTIVVNNESEALTFYAECIASGEEGAMLKNIKSVWQPKRTKDLGKMKAAEEADLRVVGWEIGTGKNVGRLGALVCSTEDNLLRVNVGIGFSDKDRDEFDIQYCLDKIITVKYNQLICDKKTHIRSLFLPRFIEFRTDKNVANTLGELK